MSGRVIKYREALSEGLVQSMERDPSIFVTGIAVDYPSGIFGTTTEAKQRFPDRVFESPAMENALTGIAIGAAAMGKRPVIVHCRNDFMFLGLDALLNLAAKWRYMYGGNAGSVPIVVRAIIGKGWGQGATHSQSLQSVLGHYPGLHVVMPATPADAKGMLCTALTGSRPTVILEHRSLYETEGYVESEWFAISNYGHLERVGDDLTIVATSSMVVEATKAADALAQSGIECDVINLRSIRPLDRDMIMSSVRKTGRLIVCDGDWKLCGVASEVAACVVEEAFGSLKAPIKRITWQDCPCPVSVELEKQFYPTAQTIVDAALKMMGKHIQAVATPLSKLASPLRASVPY